MTRQPAGPEVQEGCNERQRRADGRRWVERLDGKVSFSKWMGEEQGDHWSMGVQGKCTGVLVGV